MVTKKSVAIIPARGGSKRLPKKNILDFFGMPMLAYTIKAAQDSGIFDSIIVSTDSEEIAQVARNYGAEIPFLRQLHADDHSTVSDVVIHTLHRLETEQQRKYDIVGMLMPNCPLRGAVDVQRLYEEFLDNKRNFQISAFKYGWMNPWWAHTVDNSGQASSLFKDKTNSRSQDMKQLYCPTGAFWLATVADIMKSKTFYGPQFNFAILDWKAAVDIDDHEDLEMAKATYLLMHNLLASRQ